MAGFTFELEHEGGTPANPPVLHTGGGGVSGDAYVTVSRLPFHEV